MLVAKSAGTGILPVFRREAHTLLGEGVPQTGNFSEEAVNRTLAALQAFKEEAQRYTTDIFAFCASRRLENGHSEFWLRIQSVLGTPVQELKPEQEAMLLYTGPAGSRFNCVLLDIGGLFSRVLVSRVCEYSCLTRPLGSVRLANSFPVENNFSEEQFYQLRSYVITRLKEYSQLKISNRLPLVAMVGFGGALQQQNKTASDAVSFAQVEAFARSFCQPVGELPGIIPEQSYLVPYEALVLYAFMARYEFSELMLSERDCLDSFLKAKWEGRL